MSQRQMDLEPVFFSNGDARIDVFNAMSIAINRDSYARRACASTDKESKQTSKRERSRRATTPQQQQPDMTKQRKSTRTRLENLEIEVATLKTKIEDKSGESPTPFFE
jgi:uncharacterized protein (DUF3084 family)